ncbi:MAG: hypothetical protein AAF385_03980 [Pseudomonadota bacterium]
MNVQRLPSVAFELVAFKAIQPESAARLADMGAIQISLTFILPAIHIDLA